MQQYFGNIHRMKIAFIRSFSGRNVGKYGPEKLRIRALFMQCQRRIEDPAKDL